MVTMPGKTTDERQPNGALTTLRLVLRPFPWEAVGAIVAGRRLDDWCPEYPTDGDTVIAGILHRAGPLDDGESVRWGHWQVLGRSSGLVIGGVGFMGPPAAGEVEVGYGIVPAQQGRGYATEAAGAAVAYAAAADSVTAVVAGADHDNEASQRVLEKLGFLCVERGGDPWRYRLDLPS
jgi:ribosomal-protein-alanine N-acetyltransferase